MIPDHMPRIRRAALFIAVLAAVLIPLVHWGLSYHHLAADAEPKTSRLLALVMETALAAGVGLALGLVVYFTLTWLPRQAQKATIQALNDTEERLQIVIDNALDGIFTLEPDGRLSYLNPAAARLFQYERQTIMGMNVDRLFAMGDGSSTSHGLLQTYLDVGVVEVLGKRRDGSTFPAELCLNSAHQDNHTLIIGTVRDITERKQNQERLTFLANYDSLTGLPNRSLFRDRLAQAILRTDRNERLMAVMFLDLDRFKTINDSLGHEAGDQLLRQVADRLRQVLRKSDTISRGTPFGTDTTISRLGGDEFTVIVENMRTVDDATAVATKILSCFEQPFALSHGEIYTTTSIGITIYPFDDVDIDNLLRNADVAMYRAKQMGRNTYLFYTEDMNHMASERLTMETELRHALERKEFVLHYQPKMAVESGEIVGAEALLRWQHPVKGLVPPSQFIQTLEETGLILPVGEWVIRETCAQLAAWRAKGLPPLVLSANLSPRQFSQRNLFDAIARILTEVGIDPSWLELEITENLLMDESRRHLLARLRDLGMNIAVDDFGTGYSSLGYLNRFPIDALKIDRSFVQNLSKSQESASITAGVIALAKSLHLKVIAEGVETEEQLQFLREHGCDEVQGYLLSRPLPASEFEQWLESWQEGLRVLNSVAH